MVDVFLSYSRTNADIADKLVTKLAKEGMSVWRDVDSLAGGRISDTVEDALNQAKCILVLWSVASVDSDWVRGEADVGRKTRKLVAVSVDGTQPRIPFREIDAIPFEGWDGSVRRREFRALVAAIRKYTDVPAAFDAACAFEILTILCGLFAWRHPSQQPPAISLDGMDVFYYHLDSKRIDWTKSDQELGFLFDAFTDTHRENIYGDEVEAMYMPDNGDFWARFEWRAIDGTDLSITVFPESPMAERASRLREDVASEGGHICVYPIRVEGLTRCRGFECLFSPRLRHYSTGNIDVLPTWVANFGSKDGYSGQDLMSMMQRCGELMGYHGVEASKLAVELPRTIATKSPETIARLNAVCPIEELLQLRI